MSATGPETSVSAPLRATSYVVSALEPAEMTANRPLASKSNANGTGSGEGFCTPSAVRPFGSTGNTSIVPWLFVVTMRSRPSGVKPTWPGESRKNGGFAFPSPNVRVEPSIGCSRPPAIRNPDTAPFPPASSAYNKSPRTARLVGKAPPEAITCRSESCKPCTENVEME